MEISKERIHIPLVPVPALWHLPSTAEMPNGQGELLVSRLWLMLLGLALDTAGVRAGSIFFAPSLQVLIDVDKIFPYIFSSRSVSTALSNMCFDF